MVNSAIAKKIWAVILKQSYVQAAVQLPNTAFA